jgi:hypothetical protein
MHCVLSICIYIEKKDKKKEKKEEDNNPNPRKLTLNIRTDIVFFQ